jgi:tricorn protease
MSYSRFVPVSSMFMLALSACAVQQPDTQESTTQPGQPSPQIGQGAAAAQPDATMLRYPDVSASHIAFVYANDIWLVPREGGAASPLASPPGQESFPRFSDDGGTIAFVGNYDGNRDLYTIPVTSGVPTRITYHPSPELPCGWTPDGRLLFSTGAQADLRRQMRLATVSPEGGLPNFLPVPYGVFGAISPDGQWLAYTMETRDFSTWKRYAGGMASDIWLFHLRNHTSRRITDWEGTDSLPMWHGQDLYYMSDKGPDHKLNIWHVDIGKGKHKQVTHFTEYDVKWPSIGPGPNGQGEIVFQNGPYLYLLDLATRQSHPVRVTVPGDRPRIRPLEVDASKNIHAADISATGKRGVFAARGDIWTVPAKEGPARNLTRTCGVADRDPMWSPDGQWIAYFSDETGEYQLYITQSDGRGETKRLTEMEPTFLSSPTWSPDSKHIAFWDASGTFYVHTIETNETKRVDSDPYGRAGRLNWSHDSRWIAYTKMGDNFLSAVWLYNRETDEKHQVTSGRFYDSWPTFDRKGDYLFMASNRNFTSPAYEDIGRTFVYADTDMLLVVPLRKDVEDPFATKSDEEEWGKEKEKEKKESDEGKDEAGQEAEKEQIEATQNEPGKEGDDANAAEDSDKADAEKADEEKKKEGEEEEAKPLEIDLEGFEHRAITLPLERGSFFNLCVNHEGKLVYVLAPRRNSDGKPSIKIFDLKDEKKETKTVLDGASLVNMSPDGKKLMVNQNDTYAIVDAAPDQKLDKPLSLSGMTVTIDPRTEWQQIFMEAWRLERDYFYAPNMHGVDWPAVRDRYENMLEDCTSRADVNFVIGEMIAELSVGHAYLWGRGDVEEQPEMPVGLLGVDFELHDGAYRIARIVEGAPWDVDARGPLSRPGIDVKEGDYLLAVNGIPVDTTKDPWAAFVGLADKPITITVSEKPALDETARRVVVKSLASEASLRYRAWVEKNRAYVAAKTDGRVGYIHVPDTGVNGHNEMFRQFYGQVNAEALIIDERWNGGGHLPNRLIELLNRPITNYWTRRYGKDVPTPQYAHHGPKCMLINGSAGSGGDMFPYLFRQAGLGKLIGMRTWGGLVGISGNPEFIDGGSITVPRTAFYEKDGTWGVEGYGVPPDIEVIDDPALMVDGGDPQLDAAIEQMLDEMKRHPYRPPSHPAYPDRSGMGVTGKDR